MSVQDAILAYINQKQTAAALGRALLTHMDWHVPRPPGATAPTIIIADAALTPAVWAFSSAEAYQNACRQYTEEAIGATAAVGSIVSIIADLDPKIACWYVDPGSTIALRVLADDLSVVRKIARGMLVEAAIAERRYASAREFESYVVPYFGVLGQGHQVITLPSAKGNMVPAFSTPDAVEAFLATGSDDDRKNVNLVEVDGSTLFGEVGPMASGVLLNPAGPRTFGLPLAMCRSIASGG